MPEARPAQRGLLNFFCSLLLAASCCVAVDDDDDGHDDDDEGQSSSFYLHFSPVYKFLAHFKVNRNSIDQLFPSSYSSSSITVIQHSCDNNLFIYQPVVKEQYVFFSKDKAIVFAGL